MEDVALGEPIGRVKANDLDIGENAKSSYDIIEGDGMDIFEITTDTQTQDGIIRVRKVNDISVLKKEIFNLRATTRPDCTLREDAGFPRILLPMDEMSSQ